MKFLAERDLDVDSPDSWSSNEQPSSDDNESLPFLPPTSPKEEAKSRYMLIKESSPEKPTFNSLNLSAYHLLILWVIFQALVLGSFLYLGTNALLSHAEVASDEDLRNRVSLQNFFLWY